ncbi:hypothetical protein [Mycoplasmopsis arginini]|uniref:hypothetical protein n=1 Tax=Mycoplasmopsis arginini TaxID=2094 RepID=UPI0005C26A0E|nr:hypothetical protein [Mycoplasmopsis arginini]MCY2902950.1 hypothetical protein [Mycoplasmopsis arginini QMP CG1-2758]MDI3348992.1 hypothetical protein [Mycoplasmopsis arginini]MDI3350121.1 hypothetical protein [Mycoplasmopsis arginini]MDI3350688.1 hypothetical protein [Mycoplasmopsis arginini]MDI3351242.1 hypothetical protein [Mycoplasmopsis arginini]
MRNNLKKKPKLKSNNYWSRSWSKGNIAYFFISLILMSLLIFLTGYFKKQDSKVMTWSNAITVGCVLFIAIPIFVILIKKGFGKGLAFYFINIYHNHRISSRAKAKYTVSMNQFEKDKILNRERSLYNKEQNDKQKNKYLTESTNLASFLIIGISSLVLLVGLLSLHLS